MQKTDFQNKSYRQFLFLFLTFVSVNSFAQWNPDAGVVNSYAYGAPVITSSNNSGQKAVDNDMHTHWQSGGSVPVLPLGFLSRTDLNILLGMGATAQCTNSGGVNTVRTTDSQINIPATIPLSGGKSWVTYQFTSPKSLRSVTMKCNVTSPVSAYVYLASGDSVKIGTFNSSDNFKSIRFPAILDSVTRIKLIGTANFSLFEIGALSGYPTEYLIVDLGQVRNVGYISTRHWSNGLSLGYNVICTKIYLSLDNVTYNEIGQVNPEALYAQVIRPDTITPARYVKIEHTLKEVDLAKAFVWEVQVFDQNGPYGAFPAAQHQKKKNRDILGVNGIWGWGYNRYSDGLGANQGQNRFNAIAGHARNYHNLHWDVEDPDSIPDYDHMPFGLALWWLNWDREYGAWKNAGMKVQVSIKYDDWQWQTRMNRWDNPYLAAYNYAYAFARHFGPTYGNGLVESFEAGNEPWTYPAAFYNQVQKGMLHGARAGDPALTLLPCALQSWDPLNEDSVGGNYMGTRIEAIDTPYIDALNVHHYSYTHDWNGTRIAVYPEHPESSLHEVVNDIRFRDANMPGTPIWLSEWGWDSDGAGQTCQFGECVSELEQAVYAVRGAMMFTRLGMDRITWFFYANGAGSGLYSRSGLLSSDSTGFAEKKSFKSFVSFVNLLGNSYFLDALREDDNAWIYLFGDSLGNPTHLAAWRPVNGNDTSLHQINLPFNYMPDSTWILNGQSYSQMAPNPAYYSGVMKLQLSSAPIVIKIVPATNTAITWNGNINGNWNNPANWTPMQVPGASDDAIIPPGRPSYPADYSSNPEVRNLIIQGRAQVNLVPGHDLTVHQSLVLEGGALTVTAIAGNAPVIHVKGNLESVGGRLYPGTGRVMMDGSVPQNVSGKFDFHDLEITSPSTLNLDDTMNVTGILNVHSGSVIHSNGFLVIESGASLMHGTNTIGGGGTVTGNITAKRAGHSNTNLWNYWSSPVTGADINIIGNNIYRYDVNSATGTTLSELQRGWVGVSGSMTPGLGYISKGGGTVKFKGPANNGDLSISVRKNPSTTVGYNLIGNPYPSAISASSFIAVNGPVLGGGNNTLTGVLYFWDDDASGGGSYDFSDFAVWSPAGIVAGPNTGLTPDGNIASGQGFFVEKITDGNGSVLFKNQMRTTANSIFFRTAPIERLWISVTNPSNLYNETLIAFIDDATDSLDLLYEAKKMRGNENLALFSKLNNLDLAIQTFPLLQNDRIVPLALETKVGGVHTLNLRLLENLDETVLIFLEDTETGTFQNLRLNPQYSFNAVAGNYLNRFFLHFNPPVEVAVNDESCDGGDGQITIEQAGSMQWNYILSDQFGTVVATGVAFNGQLSFTGLNAGIYSLALTANDGYLTTKNIEVKAKTIVTAAFETPQNQIFFPNQPVTFTNLSTGATSHEWNFGDGLVSSDENPIHVYSLPGFYETELHAFNADCEDFFNSSLFIEIATGIIPEVNDEVSIFGHGDKILVKLDIKNSAEAEVFVYDLLGKELIRQKIASSGTFLFQPVSKESGCYLVKVVTQENFYSTRVLLFE